MIPWRLEASIGCGAGESFGGFYVSLKKGVERKKERRMQCDDAPAYLINFTFIEASIGRHSKNFG